MNSEFKALLRGITAGALIAITGCGGGGGEPDAEPPAPTPPGNPDTTPVEAYPVIKYQYFLGDDYTQLDSRGNASVWSYQATLSNNNVTQVDRTWPAKILHPKVAPSRNNMSFAYAVLKERNSLWNLEPNQPDIRQLSKLKGPFCEDEVPATEIGNNYFLNHQTYFYGVTRANAGIYTSTAGTDATCGTGDDQYWEVPLNSTAIQTPKQVAKEIAYAQELLDADLKLVGFIYAAPGETLKTYDAQHNLVKELGITSSYVTLHKHYSGNQAVLVIGRNVYLVDNTQVVGPDFELPAPVYTSPTDINAESVRLDDDRVYLTDGTRLVGIDYATGHATSLDYSTNYSKLYFGRSNVAHGGVFSDSHVYVLADSSDGRHLLAINKQFDRDERDLSVAQILNGSVRFDVTEEYFATDKLIYFSFEDESFGDDGYKAFIWQDNNGEISEYRHYDTARWHFYQDHKQNGSDHKALLVVAQDPPISEDGNQTGEKITPTGYFYNPRLYSYDPTNPDTVDVLPENSKINRKHGVLIGSTHTKIRELADAESGHLLVIALGTGADPLNALHSAPPNGPFKALSTKTVVCERGLSRLDVSTKAICAPEAADGN